MLAEKIHQIHFSLLHSNMIKTLLTCLLAVASATSKSYDDDHSDKLGTLKLSSEYGLNPSTSHSRYSPRSTYSNGYGSALSRLGSPFGYPDNFYNLNILRNGHDSDILDGASNEGVYGSNGYGGGFRKRIGSYGNGLFRGIGGYGGGFGGYGNRFGILGSGLRSYGNGIIRGYGGYGNEFQNGLEGYGNGLSGYGNGLSAYENGLSGFGNGFENGLGGFGNGLEGYGNVFGNGLDGYGNGFGEYGNRLGGFGNELNGFRNGFGSSLGGGYRSGFPNGFGTFGSGFTRSLGNYGRGIGLGGTTIDGSVSAILRDYRKEPLDGSYSFAYETEDGTQREEAGSPIGPSGAVVKEGSYSFKYPDGSPAHFRYVADENGFRVESNVLPEIPEHSLAQIERAERERASGIIHDGLYSAKDHRGDSNLFRSPSFLLGNSNILPASSLHSLTGRSSLFKDSPRGLRNAVHGKGQGLSQSSVNTGLYEDSNIHIKGKSFSGLSSDEPHDVGTEEVHDESVYNSRNSDDH